MERLDNRSLEEVLNKILEERSSLDSIFCDPCIAFGVAIPDSIHYINDMEGGPITSNMKCSHCYDTEAEHGRLRFTKEESEYVQRVNDMFNRLEKLKNGL